MNWEMASILQIMKRNK
jgi:hypothetical protein